MSTHHRQNPTEIIHLLCLQLFVFAFFNFLPSKELCLCKDWELIWQIQFLMLCLQCLMEFLEIIIPLPDHYFCYSLRWSSRKYLQHINKIRMWWVGHLEHMGEMRNAY